MSLMNARSDKAPILVLAVGNPSRGDDAFGPLLAQQLQTWLATQTADVQQAIELVTDQQLMVEHALDLQGREQVLFIDAAAQHDAPVALQTVSKTATASAPSGRPRERATEQGAAPHEHRVPREPAVNSHSCTPSDLLALFESLLNAPPPLADLLTLRGHGFELGAPLSAEAQALLPQAWRLLEAWLTEALTRAGGQHAAEQPDHA